MKKFLLPAILVGMTINLDGKKTPLTQDVLDKAKKTSLHGTDETTGTEVHSMTAIELGDDHIGLVGANGTMTVGTKPEIRRFMIGLADKVGMSVGYKPGTRGGS